MIRMESQLVTLVCTRGARSPDGEQAKRFVRARNSRRIPQMVDVMGDQLPNASVTYCDPIGSASKSDALPMMVGSARVAYGQCGSTRDGAPVALETNRLTEVRGHRGRSAESEAEGTRQ